MDRIHRDKHLKQSSLRFALPRRALALIGVGVALALAVEPALAAPEAPAWKLTALAAPTNFGAGETGNIEAGPLYLFEATNVGAAATAGPVTIEATLPPGMSAVHAGATIDDPTSPEPSCTTSPPVVTCTTSAAVESSRTFSVQVVVETEAGLSGPASAEATVSGGGIPPASAATRTSVGSEAPSFGFLPGAAGLASSLTAADGLPASRAGSHPQQLTVSVGFPTRGTGKRVLGNGQPRNVFVDLPRGLVVNPTAAPTLCTEAELASSSCPPASQVGVVAITLGIIGIETDSRALYNMEAPPGSASNFAFNAADTGLNIHFLGAVRNGDYGLSARVRDLVAQYPILALRIQLWGDPSSPSHDPAREASVPPQPRALLTLPSACGPLVTSARVDSWQAPGAFVERSVENQSLEGDSVEVSDCGTLGFAPSLAARPTTGAADSPSGLDVDLEIPQVEAPAARAGASARRVQVALPEGLVANPSGANGLAGCAPAQIGLTSPPGATPARFDDRPASCPGAARIGSAAVDTPLLDHALHGSVYLAAPDANPFRSLLALYVAIDDPRSGVVVKLAGEVRADPGTGRLSASFDQLPQLPIAAVELKLFGGATAPLRTPATCGAYATTSSLTPWSAPESGPPATTSDSYPIGPGPGGSACARDEGDQPNAPSFEAGSLSPVAGSHTPFVLSLKRSDGTQQLSALALTTPAGLVGRLAGTPYCPEASLAAATGRSGSAEALDPSCPAASRVGSVTIASGAGPAPYYAKGDAYLAGPYRGAPLSLASVVPAVAGPFDLGAVVVRTALHVDPETARISAVSDPIPAILRGIPLDPRSAQVTIDKPGFVLNPTSCAPMAIDAVATSPRGPSPPLATRFQVGGCRRLGFAPRVSVRFLGPTHRGAHPGFQTVLTARGGDANIRRLAVTLPATELLDHRHIEEICARARFAAGRCPAGSAYGQATVWTPLLERPLRGPVYLRASDGRLPDLGLSLDGQVHLDLTAHLDSVGGRLRNTFAALPDVPLSRVVLTMRGGGRGLLVNSGGLCARRHHLGVSFTAQNAKTRTSHPLLRTACGKPAAQGPSRPAPDRRD